VEPSTDYMPINEAIAAWNTRAQDDTIKVHEARIAELTAALRQIAGADPWIGEGYGFVDCARKALEVKP
jgi:hypothetical protein